MIRSPFRDGGFAAKEGSTCDLSPWEENGLGRTQQPKQPRRPGCHVPSVADFGAQQLYMLRPLNSLVKLFIFYFRPAL